LYPRKLNDKEKEFLFYILPENKPVYKDYRERLESMAVIGAGRFGEGNCVMGFSEDKPDLSYSSLPVFAAGQFIYNNNTAVQITIHEEFESKIEFNISNVNGEKIPLNDKPVRKWTYSVWNEGDPSPFDNDELREVNMMNKFLLVISKANKSIWIHEFDTQFNHIIPVTNFLNELRRGNKEVDKTHGIDVNNIIDNINNFEDRKLIDTVVIYNKQWRKLDLSALDEKKLPKKKKSWPSLFKKKN
jgi:hypothetical protein